VASPLQVRVVATAAEAGDTALAALLERAAKALV
jgi:hypothetical protein